MKILAPVIFISLFACTQRRFNSQTLGKLKAKTIFNSETLAKVTVTVQEGAFSALKSQGRDISDKLNECKPPNPAEADFYKKYDIEGLEWNDKSLGKGTIKKKGYMGSLSAVKPSFKIQLTKSEKLEDVSKLTFNSNRQDPSTVRQCLAYYMFEKAGLKTPLCNLVQVNVRNNEKTDSQNTGIYTIVEDAQDAMNRLDAEGVLIEGTHADFDDVGMARFEIKTKVNNEEKMTKLTEKVKTRLQAINKILSQEPNDTSYAALSELVNLDQFYSYWATETLVGHWDGYANNMNNFLMFLPQESKKSKDFGRLEFVPWGVDGTFSSVDIINRTAKNRLYSVSAAATLPNWLLKNPSSQKMYVQKLQELLQKNWTSELQTEFERLRSLSAQASNVINTQDYTESLERVQNYLNNQKAIIEADLSDEKTASFAALPRGSIDCWTKIAVVSGQIKAQSAEGVKFSKSGSQGSRFDLSLFLDGQSETKVTPEIAGTALNIRQIQENKMLSFSVAFTLPNIKQPLAFSTLTEIGLEKPEVATRHLGYANTGALQIKLGATDDTWTEIGLMGKGTNNVQAVDLKMLNGKPILQNDGSILFAGTLYSKIPLGLLLKKFGNE
jgi:hypothetical protein